MILPDTYREQIRALVDAVEDPTAIDVILAASTRPQPRRPRRIVVAACAAALAALMIVAFAFVARSNDSSTPRVRVHPAETSTLPESCVVVAQDNQGCDMEPAQAGAYLGFDPRVPNGVPAGWVAEREKLWVFRHPESDGIQGFTPDAPSVPVYNQVWTPSDVDLDTATGCPARLQVRQRPQGSGEQGAGLPTDVSGQLVYGALAAPSTCDGITVMSTMIHWYDGGIAFNLNAVNVVRDAVARIVESLSRP
jgi:hypothetical protein